MLHKPTGPLAMSIYVEFTENHGQVQISGVGTDLSEQ